MKYSRLALLVSCLAASSSLRCFKSLNQVAGRKQHQVASGTNVSLAAAAQQGFGEIEDGVDDRKSRRLGFLEVFSGHSWFNKESENSKHIKM